MGTSGSTTTTPSIAIVGAGFGGIGAAIQLRRAGYHDVTVFERADRIGGVWQHNTYPGAACDVPSHLYEFSFAPNPAWSRRYAPQAEIQAYMERVAREHGVMDAVRLNTEVTGATWDADRARYTITTTDGTHEADVLIAACGQLTVPTMPAIPGLDDFAGPAFHTARWNHDVDLTGKRVAVVGTGASAIQVVPAIQPRVAQVDVYQRTPGWTLPKFDGPYSPRAQRLFARFPQLQQLDRRINYAAHDLGARVLTGSPRLRAPLRAIGRWQIRRGITDPELARKVTPTDDIGCKRIMLTDEWYPTLGRPNVDLVDRRITQVTPTGIQTDDGTTRDYDVIVFATGFDSHGFVAPMEITGAEGRTLKEAWQPTPRAYLGASVPGFPNLFLLYGPNTNGGTGSVIFTLECGIAHVLAALEALRRSGSRTIEVRREAADAFDRELRAKLPQTVWHSGCSNWYVDEHGNDPNQWPWTWTDFRRRTETLEPGAYALST